MALTECVTSKRRCSCCKLAIAIEDLVSALIEVYRDCWEEQYAYQKMTNWDGLKSSELLSRKRDEANPDSEAEKLVQYMLARSSMMKVSHGIKTQMVPLAKVWDEKPRADMEPGTFAGYLRWASVHLEQTRKVAPVRVQPTTEKILHAGVLEIVSS